MALGLDQPRLTVDLGAIGRNYLRLCEAAPRSKIAGVVKANGYGLGAPVVAKELNKVGCQTFFVATLDEAIELRRELDSIEILVFQGVLHGQGNIFVEHRITPVINHPEELSIWFNCALRNGRRLPLALHIDTGICRLGFSHKQLREIDAAQWDQLDLAYVMSHLASAENADRQLSTQQLGNFEQHRVTLPKAAGSLANSAGIFCGEEFHFQLCRPGIAIYGGNPTPGRTNPMEPVIKLQAPVLQVHNIDEPGTVGYGATYQTYPGSRIATLGIGYADGVLRSAGNRAVVRIQGKEVPIAGRISMDLTTLDVSNLPRDMVRPGTIVDMIAGPDGIDRFASAAGTISYEILTGLGSRVQRHYVGGSA